jgi:uncharacterized low-complexity protein
MQEIFEDEDDEEWSVRLEDARTRIPLDAVDEDEESEEGEEQSPHRALSREDPHRLQPLSAVSAFIFSATTGLGSAASVLLFKVGHGDAGRARTWSGKREEAEEDKHVDDDEVVEREVVADVLGALAMAFWRICSAHTMHTAAAFFFLSCVAEKCERDCGVWHCGQHRIDGGAASRRAGEGVTAEDAETMGG